MTLERQQLRGVLACWKLFSHRSSSRWIGTALELVPALSAFSSDEHHAGPLQHREVLHDRVARELRQHLAQRGRHRAGRGARRAEPAGGRTECLLTTGASSITW